MADEELEETFLSGSSPLGDESFLIANGGPLPWERLSQENAALHRKISELTRENLDLKSKQSHVQSEISQFESEMQRSRQDYEAAISQLEEEIERLKEELNSNKNNKAFLDQSFEALSRQNQALLERLESLNNRRD